MNAYLLDRIHNQEDRKVHNAENDHRFDFEKNSEPQVAMTYRIAMIVLFVPGLMYTMLFLPT